MAVIIYRYITAIRNRFNLNLLNIHVSSWSQERFLTGVNYANKISNIMVLLFGAF